MAIALRNNLIYFFGILFILLNSFLIYKDFYYLLLFPFALIVLYLAFFQIQQLFLLIVFCTPLSLNLESLDLAGGLGFYLPTEPLLFGLLLIFLFKLIADKKNRINSYWKHPISFLILIQLIWIFVSSISSELPTVSFKFLLSRIWFVVPIYFFGLYFFKKGISNIYSFLWAYLIPLTLVLVYTILTHASYGFSEESGHWVMWPFFKDHTSYGAIIALFFPVLIGLMTDKENSFFTTSILRIMFLIFSVGLFYSYTRAAWVSVFGASLVFLLFVFKIKFKYLFSFGLLAIVFIAINFTEINYLLNKNNAEHTTENFSERIESISNISSDASNLERFNRWNSAIELAKERPIAGWGPGTYSFVYAPFQDASDLTIISTNFGTCGNAHSEYLGPLAEQGIPGMVLMLLLVFFIFYRASILYIRLEDPKLKRIVMMLLLGLVTYFTHGILNNYLDTDKASIPVWGFISIIVAIDLYLAPKSKAELQTKSSISKRT